MTPEAGPTPALRGVAAGWVLPVAGPPLRDGAVVWDDGGAIVAVGPVRDVLAAHPHAALERFPDGIAAPGLVNAHCHLEYAVYGAFGDGLPFGPWLADHMRRKRRLSPDDVRASADLGALASLESGVTTLADCAFDGCVLDAARDAGLRGIVYLEAFGGPTADPAAVVAAWRPRAEALAERAGPLLAVGVSPHAPYTVAPPVYRALADAARAAGMPLATHVAESAAELAALADGTGPVAEAFARFGGVPVLGERPVGRLVRDGILGPGATAVHAVEVDAEEVRLLAASGAGVAHCPRSNAVLGCGAAPLRALLDAGVPVGLGSDSPSSALDLDQFAEMRAAILAARVRERDAGALSPTEALALATLGGARVLGLDGLVGTLAPGRRADVVVLDLAGSPLVPAEDPAAAFVYGGAPSRVALTVVDGAVRYRTGAEGPRRRDVLVRARAARAAMIDPESR